ncbi:MAG: hypothetical protein H8E40_08430 [Chloroflexi bacterium]|nr:hypothetical protein [Chloroflexota bacterium]
MNVQGNRKTIACLWLVAVIGMTGTAWGCTSETGSYAKELNLPKENRTAVRQLEYGPNTRALLDEISYLLQEIETSENLLDYLGDIAADKMVTDDELAAFEDMDGDGLKNVDELEYGTDLFVDDSDDDGLKDGEEVLAYKTNPLRCDTDNDGLLDREEILVYETDPSKKDTDGDRLGDWEEVSTHKTDPLNKDTDGDGVLDAGDYEPLKQNSYKETVSWLDARMKRDAMYCVSIAAGQRSGMGAGHTVNTFRFLVNVVHRNVPYAGYSLGGHEYPNGKWDANLDGGRHPRDILMNYYSYHEEVQMPPDCDDIACVYDIMADYIIAQTGWDETGENQGSSGVDCDVFKCKWRTGGHIVCIININGDEYVADPSAKRFFELGEDPNYRFPWDGKGGYYWDSELILLAKFDKRYLGTIYDKEVGVQYPRDTWTANTFMGRSWDIMRNQTPENEKELEELYQNIKPLD